MFAEVTDHEGYVSMEEFAKVFERLVDEEDVSSDDLDKLRRVGKTLRRWT